MDLLGMDPNKLRPATMFTSVPVEALEQLKAKLAQAKADLKHAQKMNTELRQRASAEQQEKRYRDMSDSIDRLERENTELATEADELRTDAQRYRRLKANQGEAVRIFRNLDMHFEADAAVDALPEP